MKVYELIEKLREMPRDASVRYMDWKNANSDVEVVELREDYDGHTVVSLATKERVGQ